MAFLKWLRLPLKCKIGLHGWYTYAFMNGHRMCHDCPKWIDNEGRVRQS